MQNAAFFPLQAKREEHREEAVAATDKAIADKGVCVCSCIHTQERARDINRDRDFNRDRD